MKKFLLTITALLAVVALAACGKKTTTVDKTTTAGNTTTAAPQVDFTGFESEVTGTTVKATLNVAYNTTVDKQGGEFNETPYLREVTMEVKIEMDLGENKYLYISKTYRNAISDAESTTTEALIAKDAQSGSYYTMSTTEEPEAVEGDVVTAMNALIAEYTKTQVGALSLASFIYNDAELTWEKGYTANANLTLDEEDPHPAYTQTENGLTVAYAPEYVCYETDQGFSRFPARNGGAGISMTYTTNAKGYVTSANYSYDMGLALNFMNPAPIVTVIGNKNLTAEYGVELTKKAAVEQGEVEKKVLGTYTATVNKVEMTLVLYEDDAKTFDVSAFGKVACSGTYTLGKTVDLTKDYTLENMPFTTDTASFTYPAVGDFSTLTAESFFGLENVEFILQTKQEEQGGETEKTVFATYEVTAANGTKMTVVLYADEEHTFDVIAFNTVAASGTYSLAQTIVLTMTYTEENSKAFFTDGTTTLTYEGRDFTTLYTEKLFGCACGNLTQVTK